MISNLQPSVDPGRAQESPRRAEGKQRATIAEPALPFFFAQATLRERPELVLHYPDEIINFRPKRQFGERCLFGWTEQPDEDST